MIFQLVKELYPVSVLDGDPMIHYLVEIPGNIGIISGVAKGYIPLKPRQRWYYGKNR